MSKRINVMDFLGYYLFGKPNLQIVEHDDFGLWGRLRIIQTIDGKEVCLLDDKNTIVNNGKISVLNLLRGESIKYLQYMSIGNGNVPNTAPSVNDVALSSEISRVEFSSVDIDEVNKILEFRATFSSGDYPPGSINPEEVNEAGLFFNDFTIFARKTFTARPFLYVDSVFLTFIWSVGVA